MYKKSSSKDENQLRIEEFFLPFGGKLKKDNPWVIKAALIPWEAFESDYEKLFSTKVLFLMKQEKDILQLCRKILKLEIKLRFLLNEEI